MTPATKELTALATGLANIIDIFGGPSTHDFALRSSITLAVIGAFPGMKGRAAMSKDISVYTAGKTSKTTATRFIRIINRLQEKGFIIVRKSTTDARGQEYLITSAGIEALNDLTGLTLARIKA